MDGVTRYIGVPNILISDNTGGHTGPQTELQEFICLCCIYGRKTEPYSRCRNRFKGMIKIFKGKAKRRRIRRRVPKRIWGFGLVWEAEIYSLMAGKYG